MLMLLPRFVDKCHAAGKTVVAWGVKQPAQMVEASIAVHVSPSRNPRLITNTVHVHSACAWRWTPS